MYASTRSYNGMFDIDESSNIFKDRDEILIKQEENENGDEAVDDQSVAGAIEIKQEEIDYAPDEEDVENQLMHIDDQLIRLDENIEDISGHLDEQLLNTVATSSTTSDELLTQEQQNFLFGEMPEIMDPLHSWSFPLVTDPDEAEIDQLFTAGLPSPMMPSTPFLSDNTEDVPKISESISGEPVKQEKPDNVEEENQLYDDGKGIFLF